MRAALLEGAALRAALLACVVARAAGRSAYCDAGLRSSLGRWNVCCPAACGHCDASRCDAAFPACCPRVLAGGRSRRCGNASDVACKYPWRAARDAVPPPPAPGARSAATEPPVHVAIAGDKAQLVGTVACARSVVRACASPGRLRIHVVTDPGSAAAAGRALACAADSAARHDVRSFDGAATLAGRRVRVRPIADEKKASLGSSALNYARFYLAELLGVASGVVVYLDSDVLVLGDVAALADATFAAPGAAPVAAVPRPWKPVCGAFLNCKDASSVAALERLGGLSAPYGDLDAFNAGVLLVDLGAWAAAGLTARVEEWINANFDAKRPLYKLGSNPPLMLAVRRGFEALDARWNCQRGDRCWDAGPAARHWAGPEKPWMLAVERDAVDWLPVVADLNRSCMGPELLLDAAFASCSYQNPRVKCRPGRGRPRKRGGAPD